MQRKYQMRSCLCVKHLTRIQNQIRIPSQLNSAHQLQLTGRRKLFHISQLLGTDAVLTGLAAPLSVSIGINYYLEVMHDIFPGCILQMPLA